MKLKFLRNGILLLFLGNMVSINDLSVDLISIPSNSTCCTYVCLYYGFLAIKNTLKVSYALFCQYVSHKSRKTDCTILYLWLSGLKIFPHARSSGQTILQALGQHPHLNTTCEYAPLCSGKLGCIKLLELISTFWIFYLRLL